MGPKCVLLFLCLATSWTHQGSCEKELSPQEFHDKTILLLSTLTGGSYNKTTIPASTCNNPTKSCPFLVEIRLFPIRIQEVLESQETLVSTVRLQLGWVDPALKWNPANYGDISTIEVSSSLGVPFWTPDLQIANSVEDMWFPNSDFGFHIDSTGKVWWHPTGKISTRCAIDLTYYPFDYQRCAIVIESELYTTKFLQLVIRPDKSEAVSTGMFAASMHWKVIDVSGYPVTYYGGPRTAFSRVHFWLLLKRDSTFYQQTFLIPIALLSVLQVLTYLIPIHYVDRTSQATVVLLAAFVVQSSITDRLPKSPQDPLIMSYVNFVIGMGVATVGICVITLELVDPDEKLEFWGVSFINRKRRSGASDNQVGAEPSADSLSGTPKDKQPRGGEGSQPNHIGLKLAVQQSANQVTRPLSKSTIAAAILNLIGFAINLLMVIIYPLAAFYGYVSSTPPLLPAQPADNITHSYYAELSS